MKQSSSIILLTDLFRGSYNIIGKLYESVFSKINCNVVHLSTPETTEEKTRLSNKYSNSIFIHTTLGDSFIPIENNYNIAIPFHEWSRYPSSWIKLLEKYDQIWATSDHIKNVLINSGLTKCVEFCPPPLDFKNIEQKDNWENSETTRFLFVGESHFRKGNHLLIDGFMKAFPDIGTAQLTIKTNTACVWASPREDIVLIKDKWDKQRLMDEYSKHDCFVSASLAEGLGLPIAEAIRANLPICTNYWGGHTSLVTNEGYIEIDHDEVIQPFTSNPKYYSADQKCAYSSPDRIKKALLRFLKLSPSEKQTMTSTASNFLDKNYGAISSTGKITDCIKNATLCV